MDIDGYRWSEFSIALYPSISLIWSSSYTLVMDFAALLDSLLGDRLWNLYEFVGHHLLRQVVDLKLITWKWRFSCFKHFAIAIHCHICHGAVPQDALIDVLQVRWGSLELFRRSWRFWIRSHWLKTCCVSGKLPKTWSNHAKLPVVFMFYN